MVREAGDLPATALEPPGTVARSGVKVTVRNPINGHLGYVYVFRSDGSLDPGPGPDPVTNAFFLRPF